MAAALSQKEYLKRYLSGGGEDDKKKKKKKKKDKASAGARKKGMRIVEDSMDLKHVPYGYGEDDDDPTIAEITYEDEKMKIMEEFQANKKWKKMEDDIPSSLKGIKMMVDSDYQQDSDSSLPKKQKNAKHQQHESNASPSRRRRHDSDSSPPRQQNLSSGASPSKKQKHDSDALPPRHQRHDSDTSPPRRQRHDSDTSPPRRLRHDSVASPPRRQRHDSDASPPRRQRHDSDASPPRRQRHDSDASPPRRQRHDSDASPPRRQRHDSDASPPRRQRHDSDASPPRRQRHDSDASPPRRKGNDSDASPPRKIADGSGIASGTEVTQRPERNMTTKEYLLARRHGKLKKDTPEDLMRKEREKKLQSEAEIRNQQWKHGVKQVQQYQQKLADDAHEMGKAFARTADDIDLNSKLKEVVREDDPMLEYMIKKKEKGNKQPLKPLYKGPFPPNRLNIRPGYRWDGVDRSSGFEKQWFEKQNNRRAHDEDAYKWSVSDM